MPYLLVLLGIIIANLYVRVGKRYTTQKMKTVVLDELERLNVPREFSEKIISGLDSKVKEGATISEFAKSLEEVFNELADDSKEKINALFGSATNLTKELRSGLAQGLRRAADSIMGTAGKNNKE